ncbi:terminase small subunit [[Clostridium] polysaccharolyticum]|uniref:Phage terminase small subunit n=1 Tax=[Clostridium] polysaccharolyticum TaxID=29364 RepID=A0A1H9YK15_9FIRM|nr:terminase small subunit [[Clostridium] polysaccharolyticum]SES68937.1 phage terminase small subunit [[Clostridium] polysaccharolyticum]
MARKQNPLKEEARQMYKAGKQLIDIAKQLSKPEGTIRRWKCEGKWDADPNTVIANVQNKKNERSKKVSDGTKETMSNSDLTEKEKLFCLYYIKTFNATQSYINAFGSCYNTANAEGYKMLVKPCVKTEIDRLKEIKRQNIVADASDIVDLQMRIAFSDMGNYARFDGDCVLLENSKNTDTQLIKEVKVDSKGGMSVVLQDKQQAINWLTKFFELFPSDRRKDEFASKKLELEMLKIELSQKDDVPSEQEDDGFLECLNATAGDVWKDDNDGNNGI